MRNNKKALVKILLVAGAIATPIIYAYEYGPDPGYTAAPGDNQNGCAAGGTCHVGTINTAGGSISITASGGTSYVPGQTQTISVKITDSTEKGYGFQLSARVDSAPKTTAAGLLVPGNDNYTQVLCADGTVLPPGTACTAKNGGSLQWIEHTVQGWGSSGATPGSYTYTFQWTPPATAVGPVTLYAAGNAVTGTTQPAVVTGTHEYTTKLQLSPAAANPNAPTITSGGINPLYSSATTIQPGAWAQMYGTNLGPAGTTLWKGDFATTLGGTTVTVNGKPAPLYFVSPTQLNFQSPNDTATSSVAVVVTTANGSANSTVTLGAVGPSFLLLNGQHVTGIILRPDGSGAQLHGTANSYDLLGPTGSSFGYPTVAAKAGDSVELYAVGFGPTNPALPSGQALTTYGTATDTIQLLINNKSVTPSFAGITEAGLYQINLTIPAGLGTGDVSLLGQVEGAQTPAGVVISLQ